MNTNQNLSTWTLWQPLKFSCLFFGLTCILMFLYSIFCAVFGTLLSPIMLTIITSFSFIFCLYKLIKKLPKHNMDRTSFIMIHNAQTILYFTGTILSAFVFFEYASQNINNILFAQSNISIISLIFLTIFSIFLLTLIGLRISNIYAKFRRIRSFKIPTYKIFLTMPFGFSALWIPGYILAPTNQEKTNTKTQLKWYKKFTKWATSTLSNCIISFILISICLDLFFNFNSTLLLTTFALVFGIWALQIGAQKFTEKITGAYTNFAIIANIVLLVATIFIFSQATNSVAPDTQITITETITVSQGLEQ